MQQWTTLIGLHASCLGFPQTAAAGIEMRVLLLINLFSPLLCAMPLTAANAGGRRSCYWHRTQRSQRLPHKAAQLCVHLVQVLVETTLFNVGVQSGWRLPHEAAQVGVRLIQALECVLRMRN